MIYDIHHVTTYEYGSPVKFAHCACGSRRSTCRDRPFSQPRRRQIRRRPNRLNALRFFGNRVTLITIATEHSDLIVTVDTAIEVDRGPAPQADATAPFEAVREEAFDSASLDKDSPAHFLHPSHYVPRFAPAADYARKVFRPAAGA